MFNPLLDIDSYKASHNKQYPPDAAYISSYIEPRGGNMPFVVFAGLQAYLQSHLERALCKHQVDEAAELMHAHGMPFPHQEFLELVARHDGRWPVHIRAVPEGSVMPLRLPLLRVVNTDPAFFWLCSYLETGMLRAIWYMSTVASLCANMKAIWREHIRTSSDLSDIEATRFCLHDFGSRGVSSHESSGLGGLAHMMFFEGTDNVPALVACRRIYGDAMPAFSIPAAEHSTIISWGQGNETQAYEHILRLYHDAQPPMPVSIVIDSYDMHNAIEHMWAKAPLKDLIDRAKARIVFRPDSGDPAETVVYLAQQLARIFGTHTNNKGYKVFPSHIRIIQGDGVNPGNLDEVLRALCNEKFSAENLVVGMGSGLLQQVHRDQMMFAMKVSAIRRTLPQLKGASHRTDVPHPDDGPTDANPINQDVTLGPWMPIAKSPKADASKHSKPSRTTSWLDRREPQHMEWHKAWSCVNIDRDIPKLGHDAMIDWYKDGTILHRESLQSVRERANDQLTWWMGSRA